MIKSMTGYGRAEFANDDLKITVEIKSVNNRYLDIGIKMPRQLGMLESSIRAELKKYIKRGKVDVYIAYEDLKEANVEVKYNSKTYTNSESVIKSVFSTENAAAEETLRMSVFSQQSPSGLLCEGEKPKVPTKQRDHKTGYGLYVTFQATEGKARHDGIDYDVSKGTEVKAALSGVIVYVGETAIHGGTVVVDHGNGVRTWYCRVDTSLASVGQTVAQGDVIAKSNDSGFGDSSRVHFGVSVGETFVSPLWILDNGLPK